MERLKDKIVLITGAAGAIGAGRGGGGRAQRRHCASPAILAGRHGADHALDVTSESDWLRVIAEIGSAHDRLDGLVNAAGIAALGNIEETDFATWRQILAVNLDGTFLGCKHALPLLKRARRLDRQCLLGRRAWSAGTIFAAYNASKGGVRLLTKSVALHGARLNPQVRCNSVHPAFLKVRWSTRCCGSTDFPTRRARGSRATSRCGRLRHAGGGRRHVRLSVVGRSRASSPAPNSSSTAD